MNKLQHLGMNVSSARVILKGWEELSLLTKTKWLNKLWHTDILGGMLPCRCSWGYLLVDGDAECRQIDDRQVDDRKKLVCIIFKLMCKTSYFTLQIFPKYIYIYISTLKTEPNVLGKRIFSCKLLFLFQCFLYSNLFQELFHLCAQYSCILCFINSGTQPGEASRAGLTQSSVNFEVFSITGPQ